MKNAIAISIFGLAALGAQADQGKTYWGAEVGSAKLEDHTGSLTSDLVSINGGAASATQDSTISTFKVVGGYRHTENLDLELAYFQSGTANLNFNGVTRNAVAYVGHADMKFSGFEYAVNLRPNIESGLNNLYLRLGGHTSNMDVSASVSSTNGSASASKSYSGTGTLYGVGYDQKIDETSKVRYSAVKYSNVGGESTSGGTVISIGFIKDF